MRPNEAFSGRGHRRHLCKQCARRPRAERESVRAEMDLFGFLQQRNISAKNTTRLESLCEFDDPDVRQLAKIVLEVATVAPRRRKRVGYLRQHHPDLYLQLVRLGICQEWIDDLEGEYPMEASDGPRYFNDDGTEFIPGLYPTPDLCVSCMNHETHDAEETLLCNLTRADQRGDEVFVCFAYQPISPSTDREEVLRELCKQAGAEYPENSRNMDDGSGPIPF